MKGEHATQPSLALAILALLFNIIPFVLFLISPHLIILLLLSIFPFAGTIMGIAALCQGKKRIGKAGVIISAIAVAWPLVFVVTVIVLTTTGSMTVYLM